MSAEDTRHWATPRARQKAWDQGDIAFSSWFTMAAALSASTLYVACTLGRIGAVLQHVAQRAWSEPAWLRAPQGLSDALAALQPVTYWLLGLIGSTLGAVVLAASLQTRFAWWPRRLVPDIARLAQPGRILHWRDGLLRALLGAAPLILLPWALWASREQLGQATLGSLSTLVAKAPSLLLRYAGCGLVLLGAAALIDYAWQYRRRELRLRMTDQQIRDDEE